jgi:hypothetical protein
MALNVRMLKIKRRIYVLAIVTTFVFANVWHIIMHGSFAWANGIGALLNVFIVSSIILFLAFFSVMPIALFISRKDDLDDAEKLLLYFFSTVLVIALAALFMYVKGEPPEIFSK